MAKVCVLAKGLHIPESPRWHDGALHFVDGPSVLRLARDCTIEVVATVDCPILLGLDFAPDGSILTNDAVGRRIMRIARDGSSRAVADLSGIAATMLNEVTLMADGSLFVGEIGFDVIGGAAPETTQLIRVTPQGEATRVGPPIGFANGMTDAPDQRGFYVAAFVEGAIWHVDTAGSEPVYERAVEGLGMGVDGIAIGPGGSLWYANMLGGQLCELDAQGTKIRELTTGFPHATSLAFAPDFKQVFATVVEQLPSPQTIGTATGAIVAIDL